MSMEFDLFLMFSLKLPITMATLFSNALSMVSTQPTILFHPSISLLSNEVIEYFTKWSMSQLCDQDSCWRLFRKNLIKKHVGGECVLGSIDRRVNFMDWAHKFEEPFGVHKREEEVESFSNK